MITTKPIKSNNWQVFCDNDDIGEIKKFVSTSGMVSNRTKFEWWPNDDYEIVYLDAKTIKEAREEIEGYYN